MHHHLLGVNSVILSDELDVFLKSSLLEVLLECHLASPGDGSLPPVHLRLWRIFICLCHTLCFLCPFCVELSTGRGLGFLPALGEYYLGGNEVELFLKELCRGRVFQRGSIRNGVPYQTPTLGRTDTV